MSDSSPILTLDLSKREVSAMQMALTLKEQVLELSALIAKVGNAADQEKAVDAQKQLKRFVNLVQSSAKAVRAEINPIYDAVGTMEKQLVAEVDAEGLRLARLIGDYAESERIRVQARQEAARNDIATLQKMEQEELAAASTLEQQDEIRERYAQLAQTAAASLATEAPKAKGQVVREDWAVTVTDIHALYQFHTNCVKLEPRLKEIKTLLNAGVKVNGVTATKITNSFVRTEKEKPAIEA